MQTPFRKALKTAIRASIALSIIFVVTIPLAPSAPMVWAMAGSAYGIFLSFVAAGLSPFAANFRRISIPLSFILLCFPLAFLILALVGMQGDASWWLSAIEMLIPIGTVVCGSMIVAFVIGSAIGWRRLWKSN